MPNPARNHCAVPRQGAGFTLLELLVVMVIMGIVLSFGMLAIGDGGRGDQIEQAARRLQALIELGSDEAILQSRELGLFLTPSGYRFYSFEENGWQVYESDKLFRERELPPEVAFELYMEELEVSLEEEAETPKPQIILSSSGERAPFELFIIPDEEEPRYRLSSLGLGEVLMEGPLGRP